MKKLILLTTMLLFAFIGYSQSSHRFKHIVKVQSKHVIRPLKEVTVKETVIPSVDSKIIITKEYAQNNKSYKLEGDSVIKAGTPIIISKSKTIAAPRIHLPGKASITQKKDTLYVNYFICKGRPANDTSCIFNKKYAIILENRQYASFWYSNHEISAMTIPFKYRFGYNSKKTEPTTNVVPTVTSDVNVSLYYGYRFGKIRYMYDKYQDKPSSSWGLTIAGFAGLGKEVLDSTNTTIAGAQMLKSKRDALVLSYGIVLAYDFNNIKFGFFAGADNAFGEDRSKWNYNNKWWLGFGIGYKIALLGKDD
jgi:hypothetical protein